MEDPLEYLKLATRVARAAAERLLTQRDRGRMVTSSVDKDVKIVADYMLDELISDRLVEPSGFPVLSEERDAPDVNALREYHWIVDPLDGSFNFSRGIPFCCISIALWHGLRPVLGVVQDMERRERFAGIVGRGAWLNDEPIRVSDVQDARNAVLCTGFPVKTDFTTGAVAAFVEGARAYKKVRLLGSAALSLAYVACGRADVYREQNIALWDVAAGVAIVRAAGGMAEFRMADAGGTLTVEASNGRVGCAGTDISGKEASSSA